MLKTFQTIRFLTFFTLHFGCNLCQSKDYSRVKLQLYSYIWRVKHCVSLLSLSATTERVETKRNRKTLAGHHRKSSNCKSLSMFG